MSDSDSPTPTALQAAAGLIASGRAADAARELNALVRAAPTYAAAYVLLAKAREASGDRVRALDAWHRAHFLVPSSPLVQRERQRLLDALAPPPGAMELPEAPLPLAPEPTAADPEPLAISPETEPSDPKPAPEPPEANRATTPLAAAPTPEARADGTPDATLLPPVIGDDPGTVTAPEATDPGGWEVVEEESAPAPPTSLAPPIAPDVVSPSAPDAEASGESLPDISDATELPDDTGLDNDLDALIRDLEHAPRIKPDPDFKGPDVVPDESNIEEMASETLAQIYEMQKQYAEAAVVYEKLARQKPDRADEMERRAAEMRERAQ